MEVSREEVLEYIDTSSNPQPQPMQQPAQMRDTGILRIQIVEESKKEAFITAKVDNPDAKRVQMAVDMGKSKRREIVSKKRQAHVPDQLYEGDIQYFDQEYFEVSGQAEDLGYGDFLQESAYTVD